MGIQRLPDEENIPDFNALCPDCKGYTVHIHDLRCKICDMKTIVWCPSCQLHFKVTLD